MKKIMILSFGILFSLVLGHIALADHHAVKTSSKEGVGKFLTDAKGMTLYWFKKDAVGMSACKEGCLAKWPIYYRETIAPPAGVDKNDFGTIVREDGQKQTTFRGYPLYYFAADKAAGDLAGQGVNAVWFVVDPTNFPPK
jgi:predicted lipoprotein with Yx(FWY)xxD motif